MRLSHLFNVVSLAGLAIASPTPANPISRGATTGPRRLVVYAQDQFQGSAIEIDAFNRCVKLAAPVYTNLHSYGVVDQVCQFQDDDNCGGNTIIFADARGTEVWGRVDVGGVGGRASRARSVLCGLNAAAVKRDVQSGPGETIVCENTRESGRCETLSANGACVPIPAGSTCKYYDANCDPPTPILSFNSHSGDKFLPLDKSVGGRIGFVKCQDQWRIADVEDGSPSIKARTTAASLPSGDVAICTSNDDSSCQTMHALNACKALPKPYANNIHDFTQATWSNCEYWADDKCIDKAMMVGTGSMETSPHLGSYGKHISGISCRTEVTPGLIDGDIAVYEEFSRLGQEKKRGLVTARRDVLAARNATTDVCPPTPCDDPRYVTPD
jgi:hypothetical protein